MRSPGWPDWEGTLAHAPVEILVPCGPGVGSLHLGAAEQPERAPGSVAKASGAGSSPLNRRPASAGRQREKSTRVVFDRCADCE